MSVRSLPVIQNWDCHSCSNCCRTYHVRVNEVERERLQSQGWTAEDLGGHEPVVWDKQLGEYRLNHTPTGACVFLGGDDRCRIHAKFGEPTKPTACQVFPFVLVPAGDHWRVGVRFACPSAAANKGRPLAEHAASARHAAGLIEADAKGPPPTELPLLQAGKAVPWPTALRLLEAIDELLADTDVTLERRLRQVLAFAAMCKPTSFAALTGSSLDDFLDVMTAAAVEETPDTAAKPDWVGRTIFRQVAAIYARKDHGPDAGIAKRGRLTRIRAAWRFAVGRGTIPKLHAKIPDRIFEDVEKPSGKLGPDADALLTRYYRVKVQSGQFFGRTNYGFPFWDGLDSLVLTFPVILWLARVFAGSDARDLAVEAAVRVVDDSFGYHPLLGSARQAWATRTLAERGELARLIAWYAQ
jgi:lysine-N-methylase